jgi:predicted transcriptional regulator
MVLPVYLFMQNYTEGDILLTLKLLHERKMGRKKLSQILGFGEATARTVFRKLESKNLIRSTRKGQKITDEGEEYLNSVSHFTLPLAVEVGSLTLSEYNLASLVRKFSHNIKDGIRFRDAAIIAGACGATTLIFDHGKLIFPDRAELDPKTAQYLIEKFSPHSGDILVIATAETEQKAMRGISGCLSLLPISQNEKL